MARRLKTHDDETLLVTPKPRDNEPCIHFRPRGDAQQQAIDTYMENELIFLTGPAGTGKTQVATYCAVSDLRGSLIGLNKKRRVEKVIITRPIVEAGEKLGALPGEVNEKVHPYMLPVYDCVSKMVNNSKAFIEQHFEIAPLAYMRGRTFENCVTILDEAQNCTIGQIKLFLTRLGVGGKMIISGDTDQTDIGRRSGLRAWVNALKGEPGIGFVEFTEADIVRHPLVRIILAKQPR